MKALLYCGVATLLALPASLLAQADEAWVEKTRLETCAGIAEDIARLACFDAILGGETAANEEELRQEVEEDFGLAESRSDTLQARKEAIAEDLVISTQVTGVTLSGRRNYVLTLANGQVWRTNESGNLRHRFRGNEDVEIEKSRFGGYRLKVEGKVGHAGVVRVR